MSRNRLSEKRPTAAKLFLFVLAVLLVGWIGNDILIQYESHKPSVSKGSRVNGSLQNGKRMSIRGPNFESYSRILSTFGRTCMHEKVRAAVVGGYAGVYAEDPALLFVYGESGWCWGGNFWPHRTHQHGMSVDFMVPVRRKERVETLPATVFDLFGYGNEFDDEGKLGEFVIDWDAMALHLRELDNAAAKNGLRIERVIFDPKLQKHLFAAKGGKRVKKRLKFVTKPVWVRHDDHYHVDFVGKDQKKDDEDE